MDTKKNENEEMPEIVEEYSSNESYISACSDAMMCIDTIDPMLMDKEQIERLKVMRQKVFDVLERSINEMYDEVFFDEVNPVL